MDDFSSYRFTWGKWIPNNHPFLLAGQAKPVIGEELATGSSFWSAVDLGLALPHQKLGLPSGICQPGRFERVCQGDMFAVQKERGHAFGSW
jgi:hypothetical protein